MLVFAKMVYMLEAVISGSEVWVRDGNYIREEGQYKKQMQRIFSVANVYQSDVR